MNTPTTETKDKVAEVKSLVIELLKLDREINRKFPESESDYIENYRNNPRVQEIRKQLIEYGLMIEDFFDETYIDNDNELFRQAFGDIEVCDIEF